MLVRLPRTRQYLFAAAIGLAYILRDLTPILVSEIAFVALFGMAFCLLDVSDGLGIYAMSIALTLPGNPIRLMYVLVTVYKLNHQKKLRLNVSSIVCVCALLLIQLLNSIAHSSDGHMAIIKWLVEYVAFLIIPVLWFSNAYTNEGKRNALLLYVAGLLIGYTCIIVLTVRLRGFEMLFNARRGVRLGMGLNIDLGGDAGMTSSYNTNAIATTCSFGVAALLSLMDAKKLSKWLGGITVGLLVFVTLLTKSRTGILALCIIAMCYYVIVVVRRKKYLQGLGVILVVATVMYLAWRLLPQIWESILTRFTDSEDLTNGRMDLSTTYLDVWSKDIWCFFFGYGVSNYVAVSGVWNSAHNAIVDMLMCCGLLGTISLIIFLVTLFGHCKQGIPHRYLMLAVLPVLVNFFTLMAGQYLTVTTNHVRFCFLMLSMPAICANEERGEMLCQREIPLRVRSHSNSWNGLR